MRHRLRVVQFGTFDVQSYGDLLFPLLARHFLPEVAFTFVSPAGGPPITSDAVATLPLTQAAAAVSAADAVLVGGGDIIDFGAARLPAYDAVPRLGPIAYPGLWLGASLLAGLAGKGVAWLAPGLPRAPEPGFQRDLLSACIRHADLVALREADFVGTLAPEAAAAVRVTTDPAVALARLWSRTMLAAQMPGLTARHGLGGPYTIVHVKQRSISRPAEVAAARANLERLARLGPVLLLPAGRVHQDEVALLKLAEGLPGTFAMAAPDLSLQETTALIAHARAVLSCSLHVAIAASAYGVPVRVLATPGPGKCRGFFEQSGAPERVVGNWAGMAEAMQAALASPPVALPVAVENAAVQLFGDIDAALRDTAGRRARAKELRHEVKAIRERYGPQRSPAERRILRDIVHPALVATRPNGLAPKAAPEPPAAPPAAARPPGRGLAADLARLDPLVRAGDWMEAEALCRSLLQAYPGARPLHHRLVSILATDGRLEEARDVFAESLWPHVADPKEVQLHLVQLTAGADAAASLAWLRRLDAARPGLPLIRMRMASRLALLGGTAEAIEMLRALRAENAATPRSDAMLVDLLLGQRRGAEALEPARALLAAHPEDMRSAERLVVAAILAGERELAVATLEAALRRWPQAWELVYRFSRLPLPPADVARLFPLVQENAARPDFTGGALFHYALACLEQGQEDVAIAALERASAGHATHLAVPPHAALLRLRAEPTRQAVRFTEDRLSDFRVLEQPGAQTMLVVFAGLMGFFGYLPMAQLDRLLVRTGAHCVYLHDRRTDAYLSGLPSLGADEDTTIAALRAQAARLGARRIVTLGASLGGFGSFRYAAQLGADAAISLAGPLGLNLPDAPRGVARPAKLNRMLTLFGRSVDLLPQMQTATATRFLLAYSEANPGHARQAGRLAGLPNARAWPLRGETDRQTAMLAIADRSFDAILAEAGLPL